MELTTTQNIARNISDTFERHGIEWADYGPPSTADIEVAITAMLEYLEADNERVQMEMPAARLKIVKDSGRAEVWVHLGDIDAGVQTDEPVELPEV